MFYLEKGLTFILLLAFTFEAWPDLLRKRVEKAKVPPNEPAAAPLQPAFPQYVALANSTNAQQMNINPNQASFIASAMQYQNQVADNSKSELDEIEKLKQHLQSQIAEIAIMKNEIKKKSEEKEKVEEPQNPSDTLESTSLEAVRVDTEQDPVQKMKLLFEESNLILNNVLTKEQINKIPATPLPTIVSMLRNSINNFNKSFKNIKKINFKSPALLNLIRRSGKLKAYLAADKLLDRFKIIKSIAKNLSEDDFLNNTVSRLKTELASFDRSMEKQVDLMNITLQYEKISKLLAAKPNYWPIIFRDFNDKNNSIKYLFDFELGCEEFFKQDEDQ